MIGSGFDRFFWNPQEGAFRDDRDHPGFNRVLGNFAYRTSHPSIKIRIAMYQSTREPGRACIDPALFRRRGPPPSAVKGRQGADRIESGKPMGSSVSFRSNGV
jgi:hypothetical protein